MNIKEKIKKFIIKKNLSVKEFEESINVSNGYVNSIKNNIGVDKVLKIIDVYPEFNLDYLLYEKGEPIKNNQNYSETFLKSTKKDYEIYGEETDIFTNKFGNRFIIIGENTVKIETNLFEESLFDKKLKENTFDFDVLKKFNPLEQTSTFKIDSITKGKYISLLIQSDAMWNNNGADTPNGAEVLAREIDKHNLFKIQKKSMYGVVFITNKGLFFRDFIIEKNTVKLISRNKFYKDVYVDFNDIHKTYNVVKRSF